MSFINNLKRCASKCQTALIANVVANAKKGSMTAKEIIKNKICQDKMDLMTD